MLRNFVPICLAVCICSTLFAQPPRPVKPAKVKGGGWTNDNMTLVRGVKPTPKKKDLPARKDVTVGKKRT